MPLWVLGLVLVLLIVGVAARQHACRDFGRLVMVASLVLLVLPFLTMPVGSTVVRFATITSENPAITLFFRSVSTSLTVSVVAVLMAFPIAYYLAFCRGKSKYTWLVIVIAPFLTSYLLRVLAFKVILTDDGLVNTAFFATGLREDGNQIEWLLYTQFTVLLVLLYGWVSFVTACRSSSRSRTWIAACSRPRPTSARAGCARSSRSRCRSPRRASSRPSSSSSSRRSASS